MDWQSKHVVLISQEWVFRISRSCCLGRKGLFTYVSSVPGCRMANAWTLRTVKLYVKSKTHPSLATHVTVWNKCRTTAGSLILWSLEQ